MNYREIVAEAWQFTQENKKYIIWYAAIPAFFSTLFGALYVVYQYFAFLASPLFENWSESFGAIVIKWLLQFFRGNIGLILPAILGSIIFAFGYFILPIICQAALIQIIARVKNNQPVRVRHGIRYGLLSFLSLFEYRLLIRTLGVTSVLGVSAIALRSFGLPILNLLIPVNVVAMLIGFIFALFVTYTEFFIVIDDFKVIESISKSSKLVITHLEETFLLSVLMLIIGVRIIIQVLFVFLIPVIIVATGYFFTAANLPHLAFWIGGGAGLICLIIASYLNGIIHVFSMSVWTFTFLKLTTDELVSARGVLIPHDTSAREQLQNEVEAAGSN